MATSTTTKGGLLAAACLVLLLTLFAFPLQAQAEQSGALWGKNYGGPSLEQFNDVVELDDGGFIAVGQAFGPSADLGGGITWGWQGEADAIAVRCAADGSVIWAHNYGGAEGEHFTSVVSDGTYVYAVGSSDSKFSTNLMIDFGIAEWISTDTTGTLHDDGIVLKLNISDGKPEWARCYGGSDFDILFGATLIENDTLCVVGKTAGAGIDPVWSAPVGLGDALMFTIDVAAGAPGWVQVIGGPGDETFYDVAYAGSLGLVVCGESTDVSTQPASPAWGHVVGDPNPDYQDAILVAARADTGALTQARNCGSTSPDVFNKITIAPDGTAIVVGHSLGVSESLDGYFWSNVGEEDMVAVRYDYVNDAIYWAQNFGSAATDYGQDVTVSKEGHVYLVGVSEGASTNMKALGAPAEWGNLGEYDAIVTKLEPYYGKPIWTQNFGGPKSDGFYACAPTMSDGIYAVAGSYEKSTNLTSLGATSEWGFIGGQTDAMATKVAPRFDLTVQKGTDTTAAGPYFAESSVALKAEDPPAGQVFKTWKSKGKGTFADPLAASTTFTMPNSDVTVVAEFATAPKPPDPPDPDPDPDPDPPGPTPDPDPNPPSPAPDPEPKLVGKKVLVKTGDAGIMTIALITTAFVATSLIAFGARRRKKVSRA